MQDFKAQPANLMIGCPMWHHKDWQGHLYSGSKQPPLYHYSRLFNSVEGNTSFYHMPSVEALKQWQSLVPSTFQFTFKFPQTISHSDNLNSQPGLLAEVIETFDVINQHIACLMLQLPARFGPERLSELEDFLSSLPRHFTYGVEVRHMAFYDKSENEQTLNRLLNRYGINRVVLDTRGLFSDAHPDDALVQEVQSKKPRVPCNVVATHEMPIVRFVGHPLLSENRRFFKPWITKIHQWLALEKQVVFFFHMPDNALAPWLAQQCMQDLQASYPDLRVPEFSLPARDQQLGFFE